MSIKTVITIIFYIFSEKLTSNGNSSGMDILQKAAYWLVYSYKLQILGLIIEYQKILVFFEYCYNFKVEEVNLRTETLTICFNYKL